MSPGQISLRLVRSPVRTFDPEAVSQFDVNHCQLSVVISSLLPALCGDVSVAVTC